MLIYIKRAAVFLFLSFFSATCGFYVLQWLMGFVFGGYFRMHNYHEVQPLGFILICSIWYTFIALGLSKIFLRATTLGRIGLTLIISILTVLLSSPFGGMLYLYYDMASGSLQSNWYDVMLVKGTTWGLELGWLIVAYSFPYNVLGMIACYFITLIGSKVPPPEIE